MKTFDLKSTGVSPELRLGIRGFEYSDLYKPERLKELADVFECEVAESNPELEENLRVQGHWKHFHARQHKRRRCFIKHLAQAQHGEGHAVAQAAGAGRG